MHVESSGYPPAARGLHLRVHGKGGKLRYLPLHPGTAELITDYLEAAGHGLELGGALFRPVKNNIVGRTMEGAITADGIYKMVRVAVSGRLSKSSWTGRDGAERSGFSVCVDGIASARTARPGKPKAPPHDEQNAVLFDDELRF